MTDVYSNGISRRKRNSNSKYGGWKLVLLMLDILMGLLMLVLMFCSFSVIISQYVSPEKSGVLSIISLGSPIIYLFDVLVMFYWIVRWRWYLALAMIVTVFTGLFYLSRYYRVDFDRQYPTSYNENSYTKIMTYNVHEGKKEAFFEYIATQNPDILCVQEMTIGSNNWNTLTDTYQTTYKPNVGTGGNQILSKYKIIRSGDIGDLPRRTATWADLLVKGDTIRVVSLHLQTTSIRPEDTHFIEDHEYLHDDNRQSKLRSIARRLVDNNRTRAQQAQQVVDFLKETTYKVILCGDFNDTPLSYTYRLLAKGFDDAFSEKAHGFAYTYDTQYKLLRIDNILVSPEIEVCSYEVDNNISLSDHYPVISRVKIKKPQ